MPELHQVSPKHSFVPLCHDYTSLAAACDTVYVPHHQDKDFFFSNSNKNNGRTSSMTDLNSTPPASPFDLMKSMNKGVSPTLSTRTAATVDSFESSFASFTSPVPSPTVDRRALPYIPTAQSFSTPTSNSTARRGIGATNAELNSMQRGLWVPPRNIAVRQFLQHNAAVAASSPAPSYSSVSSRASPVQHRSAAASPVPRKSLFAPVREEQDPNRKTRLKTELCLHYINKTQCPFGANCTYAHGEEELQLTKLMDLHEAGLVDVATYRTVPCLTFVSTGSWYVLIHVEVLFYVFRFFFSSDHFTHRYPCSLFPFSNHPSNHLHCHHHFDTTLLLSTVLLASVAMRFTILVLQALSNLGCLIPRLKATLLRLISMSMLFTRSVSTRLFTTILLDRRSLQARVRSRISVTLSVTPRRARRRRTRFLFSKSTTSYRLLFRCVVVPTSNSSSVLSISSSRSSVWFFRSVPSD